MQVKTMNTRARILHEMFPNTPYEDCIVLSKYSVPIRLSDLRAYTDSYNLDIEDVLNVMITDKVSHNIKDIISNNDVVFYTKSSMDSLAAMIEENAEA